ncbi:MAG TPA: hypothetical protein VJ302_36190 [Blastocatellia bacterium]|nr:hypothetical protein [Blastocatellia bacterium]
MKTIKIEIGDLDQGRYPLRLRESTAPDGPELARGTIPQDLKAPGVDGEPLTYAETLFSLNPELSIIPRFVI